MAWKFSSDVPIWIQIMEKIELRIVSGQYKPGGEIPSVRKLAAEAAVNPNTVQKSFQALESSGLFVTRPYVGHIVTEDTELIEQVRQAAAKKYTAEYIEKMRELGMTVRQCVDMVDNMEIKE